MPFLCRPPPPTLLSPPPPRPTLLSPPPPRPPPYLLRFNHEPNPLSSVNFPVQAALRPLNYAKRPSPIHVNPVAKTLNSLGHVKPYLLYESRSILCGWLCSFVSVVSLSQIVPKLGNLTTNLNDNAMGLVKLRCEGFELAALTLTKLVAGYLQQAFLWEAALNSVYRIRLFVFEKVLERELRFFEGGEGVPSGDIAYRITAEASDVGDTLYAFLNTVVPSSFQVSAMARQMLVASPILTLISAMVIPAAALVIAYLGERLRNISRKAQLATASLSAYLNEVIPAILLVKANYSETSENIRFQRLAHTDLSERLKKKKTKALIPQIVQIIYFGSLLVLCIGSLTVAGTSFSSYTIVSFVTSLVFLIKPILDLGKAYNELKQGEPAIERVFDLTHFKDKVFEKPDAIELENVTGEVEFIDISFSYGEHMPTVLDGLNLHVKAGETVALVGPSGGGKTTLIKLLLRLYEPLTGSIFIDKHKIENIKLESLRRHVGLVSQDIILFSGTVAENIGYKDIITKIDMKKVELAAQTANADEFIRNLSEGYNTCIGPRGSSLSGGQKQRLAFARALYQNSSILVLDEATSALDSRSELLVRQALERLMQNRTVIVIAHRLETVLMAERVFLLEDGKLKELSRSSLLGTHKESLSSAGLVI